MQADSRLIKNAWVFYEVILLSRFMGDGRTGWPTAVLPVSLKTLQQSSVCSLEVNSEGQPASCIPLI